VPLRIHLSTTESVAREAGPPQADRYNAQGNAEWKMAQLGPGRRSVKLEHISRLDTNNQCISGLFIKDKSQQQQAGILI
jgi:hypothetical protein